MEEANEAWLFADPLIRHEFRAKPGDLWMIPVDGDSMEPLLSSGDRVLIDTTRTVPVPPGIFVIWDGMGLVAKRIEHVPHSDPTRLILKSVNPEYDSHECAAQEIRIVGRAAGHLGGYERRRDAGRFPIAVFKRAAESGDQAIDRMDPPRRTDLGDEVVPAEYKGTLYGEQRDYRNGGGHHFQYGNLAVDHIIPRVKEGTDHAENLQLLYTSCNSMKGVGTHEALLAKLKAQGLMKT